MADQDLQINIRTTADAAGIKEIEAALARLKEQAAAGKPLVLPPPKVPPKEGEEVGKKLGEHIGHGFERLALHAVGIGAFFQFIEAIKQSAEQINKITESLDRQGEQLVKNVQLMAEASRFAQTQADIIKIGESGLKGVEEQHKNIVELQKQELSYWQQFIDSILKGGFIGVGPLQQALDSAVETAADLEERARESTYYDILAARTMEARHAAQSYAETLAELNQRMQEQEKLADIHLANKDIASYLSAASAAEKYKNEIEDLNKKIEKTQSELGKRVPGLAPPGIKEADAQVQAILKNEQAAAAARAAGREREADLFQEAADQYKKSATPQQLADLEKIHALQDKLKPAPAAPVGRKADIGESQELVDQIERNRKAFEKQLERTPEPMVETGTGGPSLIGAEAEAARKAGIAQTAAASKKAEEDRNAQIAQTAAASKQAEEDRKAAIEEERRRQQPQQGKDESIGGKLDAILAHQKQVWGY